MWLAASLVGALIALVGCGDGDSAAPPEPADGRGSLLELTLDPDGPGGAGPLTETVDCPDPPRAGPDELCGMVLLLGPGDFEPVAPDVACTEIYGGPDTLTVAGTLAGEPVEGRFTRENGCEIDRFEVWAPVLRRLFPGYRPGEALGGP